MAAPLPHLGLRFNTNPYDPLDQIIKTYDLAMDSPQNYNPGRKLASMQFVDYPVPEFIITEVVRQTSTRGRNSKGLGTKLGFDIAVSWQTGNAPVPAKTYENEVGTVERDGWEMGNFFNIGMSSFADGISTYCWLTPNLDWQNPLIPEQWIRVVPAAGSYKLSYGNEKVYTRAMSITLVSAINFKTVDRQYARRGFEYPGVGTVSTAGLSTTVTGVLTTFLTDFIKRDYIVVAGVERKIASIQSNTQLTLSAAATIPALSAYTVRQRSCDLFSVPIYNLTPYVVPTGWGASGWGDSWGN